MPASKRSLDTGYTEVLGRLPGAIAKRLEFLLPFKWVDPRVKGLFMAKRASPKSNRLILGDPVEARPWDWTTYDAVAQDSKATASSHSPAPTLPNNTSISLEHFIVRTTGERARDRIPARIDRVEAELRNTYDRFNSESPYERDWRDGRVGWTPGGGAAGKAPETANAHTPASAASVASPLDAARSPLTGSAAGRSSAPESPISTTTSSSHTGGSRTQKVQASSLRNEIRMPVSDENDPSVEDAAVGRGQKRKAEASDMENFNPTSSGSHPSQIPNTSPSLPRANAPRPPTRVNPPPAAGPSATSAAGTLRLPQRPTAPSLPPSLPGQARHPLPPKPQFSTTVNSTVAPAAAAGIVPTQVRGGIMPNVSGGSDVGAVKRKREATRAPSGSAASPIAALDPKKRRTAPVE